jgi:hypothetical protein
LRQLEEKGIPVLTVEHWFATHPSQKFYILAFIITFNWPISYLLFNWLNPQIIA